MDLTRLWKKVNKTSTCWLWTGYKNKGGYGCITIQKKSYLVHRVVFEALVGPIPDGKEIDHFDCHVRHCGYVVAVGGKYFGFYKDIEKANEVATSKRKELGYFGIE